MTAAPAAAAAVETATDVVETVIDNSGKTLAYLALLGGASFVVYQLVRRYGEHAMDAAESAGYLSPPSYATVTPIRPADDAQVPDDDEAPEAAPYGGSEYAETGDGQWAQ